VLLLIFTVIEYIIKVYGKKNFHEGSQYLSHYSHKRARSVCQTKWHGHQLTQIIIRFEGSAPFIIRADSHLVVATLQINLGEYFGSHIISNMLSSRGMRKRYFTVILLIVRLFTHIR